MEENFPLTGRYHYVHRHRSIPPLFFLGSPPLLRQAPGLLGHQRLFALYDSYRIISFSFLYALSSKSPSPLCLPCLHFRFWKRLSMQGRVGFKPGLAEAKTCRILACSHCELIGMNRPTRRFSPKSSIGLHHLHENHRAHLVGP